MTRALVSLFTGVIAFVATREMLKAAIPRAPLVKPNYRGVSVATGLGVLMVIGATFGAATFAVVRAFHPLLAGTSVIHFLTGAFGFAMIGLFDDLTAEREHGFRGHVRELGRGHLTSGGLKLIGGVAIAIVVAEPSPSAGWLIVNAATVALFANLFNAFDLRPGRAIKMAWLAGVPLTVVSRTAGVPAAIVLGASLAFLPSDLSERAMLGDAGSNALGAMLGAAVVFTPQPDWFRLSLLGLLAILTILAERPGYSVLIEKTPGLKGFDRFGRI